MASPRRHVSTLGRIDVKLRHAFNPHLITKNAAENGSTGVINGRAAKTIVGIRLLPRRAVFQLDDSCTAQTAKATIHPADNQIHLRLGSFGRCFLRRLLAVASEPAIKVVQLFIRKFVQAGLVKLLRGHRLLDTALVLVMTIRDGKKDKSAKQRW